MISVLLLDPETVVVKQCIDLLRKEHPQIEGDRLLLTGEIIAEIPSLAADLCGGIVSHGFRNSDAAPGMRLFIFRNGRSLLRLPNEQPERRIEDLNHKPARGVQMP